MAVAVLTAVLAVALRAGLEAAALAVVLAEVLLWRRTRLLGCGFGCMHGRDLPALFAARVAIGGGSTGFAAFAFPLAAPATAAFRLTHPMRDSLSVFVQLVSTRAAEIIPCCLRCVLHR